MSVKISYGGQDMNLNGLAGESISSVFEDDTIRDLLNITGNESFEVRNNGGNSWYSVSGSYEIQEGDEIRLTRPSGTKG